MPKALHIDENILRNLYLKEKRGSYEIGKILGCSPSHVRNKLWALNISRSLQEAKLLVKPLHKRTDFSGDLQEKAYIIGFRLGDLHVYKRNPKGQTVIVKTNTTKEEQLVLFESLFSKYGYVKRANRDRAGAISIRTYLNRTFEFLCPKADKIEGWILKSNKYFTSFLAGYIDAEATFCLCGGDGVMSIKTQDKNILFAIWRKLNYIGILCKKPSMFRLRGSIDYRGIINNKDAYILTVYRKDSLLTLIKILEKHLQHGKRIKDMRIVEKNVNDRNIKYNFKKDNRWLKTYKT